MFIALHAGAASFDYEVKIDAPEVLKIMLEKNLDIVRWRGNASIDAAQLDRLYATAPEQIKTLVATEGYYSPKITGKLNRQADKSLVTFEVNPGPPTLVGSVDIQISDAGTDADTLKKIQTLRESWSLKQGQLFRQADWEEAKTRLQRQAALTRTPKAQIAESSAVVDPVKAEVALKVVLNAGPVLRFGALQIEGLQRFPASVVNNLNQIKEGDFYSETALLDLQSRLQDTGYFSGVDVSVNLDSDAATLPVMVMLTENKLKRVVAGVGYSTNTGNRAQLNYDDLSVFGLKLKSGVTLETIKQTARGELFWPVTPKGYNDSIAAQFERNDITGEVINLSSIAGKRVWGNERVQRSLTLEYLTERKSIAGLEQSHSQSLPLTYGLTLRRTNNLLFPTEGNIISSQIGAAPLPLLTDRIFLRASTRVVSYHALGPKNLLILRGEFGAVLAKDKDGIPEPYLFRAGGDQSVRGYAYQQFGVASGTATVGGRYMTTVSVEAQHWLSPAWGVATFYDAGDAADTPATLHLKSGYGVGARWKSPVGPINLDVAYGHATKQYRLHFSLGFTF